MNNKFIFIGVVVVFALFIFIFLQQESWKEKDSKNSTIPNSLYCTKDSDCVDDVTAFPQCSHYCFGEECEEIGGGLCSVISKKSEDYDGRKRLACVWNAPCKKPSKIECKDNICIAY